MTEKSSLTASAVASKLDANVNFIQGPCRAAGINAFKAQCMGLLQNLKKGEQQPFSIV